MAHLLLCALALAPLGNEVFPLPEELEIADIEQVAVEATRFETTNSGVVGWSVTAVSRGQQDGAERYVVHRQGERLDFEMLGFRSTEIRGIYDAELKLIREYRLDAPLGQEAEILELHWNGRSLLTRQGQADWFAIEGSPRPTADTDIALLVHGLEISVPWTSYVYADEQRVDARTMQPGVARLVEGEEMIAFEVVGGSPAQHVMRDDGIYMHSEYEEEIHHAVQIKGDWELALRREVADNEVFMEAIDERASKGWLTRQTTFGHPGLGLSLELPKTWRRTPDGEIDGNLFFARSINGYAMLSISSTVLGTGYNLEGWSTGLREVFEESAQGNKIKLEDRLLGETKATRIEFVSAFEKPCETVAYAWERNGLGILVVAETYVKASDRRRAESASILRSLAIAK